MLGATFRYKLFLDRLHFHMLLTFQVEQTLCEKSVFPVTPVPMTLGSLFLEASKVSGVVLVREILALSTHILSVLPEICVYLFHFNRARGKLPRERKSNQIVVQFSMCRMGNG